ncbi:MULTISPECIES: type II secretion system protein N [unclassified Acinetobacter]|uniref:type II secretion system protein N n=1 Tax=unclassified Acinetobacter TaxID=196816 RepID=UPI002934CC00|nr:MULTISPECIES: type II secretion system protein N [unclassified Acinetobacter]WOE30644.1 type II secretion system protein N [Acinetobacter sp. SAAs470]WOE38836.1 type II secretion system protein N [Acinetobacter sp. SAAs474]
MNIWLEKLQYIQWQKLNKIAPLLLVLVILYLCWRLASLFWLIIAPPQMMQTAPVKLGSQQLSIPNISSFALFAETQQNLTQSNLNFQLQGVMLADTPQQSSAVIMLNDVAERYRVGDMVASTNYQLVAVHWDHVVLMGPSGSPQVIQFKAIENGLYQPMLPVTNSLNASSATLSTDTSTQQAMNQAIQNLQQDKTGYLKDIGIQNKGEHGYQVTAKTPNALKQKLRLQDGDQILTLNGQKVQGQNEIDLLEKAKREGQVKLEVKRGDQVITVQQNFE